MTAHPKPTVVKNPQWLQFVRQSPCRVAGPDCNYAFGRTGPDGMRLCEPNHLRTRSDDRHVTPLCPGHHRTNPVSWHNGKETFMAHYRLTFAQLMDEAESLYAEFTNAS